ncbi:hypothetical protein [Lentiprolixibacter aurantiacus]|uniref:Uncharacterized protein n=1 Tax=Lentiprolixibacter aurantiacus TaxID=2993939 RepID=A0AAE3MJD8_9FLAO|nr:hypothetical protein [Lentiprolixibacter aurantiacus]MCX2718870.1 hypothetical protein [Lentiprolixibacter aurantiacus]
MKYFLTLIFSVFCLSLQAQAKALAEDDIDWELQRLEEQKRELEKTFFPAMTDFQDVKAGTFSGGAKTKEQWVTHLENKLREVQSFVQKRNLRSLCSQYDNLQQAIASRMNSKYSSTQCDNIDLHIQAIRDKIVYYKNQINNQPSSTDNTRYLSLGNQGNASDSTNGKSGSGSGNGDQNYQQTPEEINQANQLAIQQEKRQREQREMQAYGVASEQIVAGDFVGASYTFANAGMLEETVVTAGLGAASQIVSGLQAERQENIENRTQRLNASLRRLPEEDEKVRQLFINGKYNEFFTEEKKLRSSEESALSNANWLIDKAKATSLNSVYREISERRADRIRLIMKYQTDTLVKLFKTLKNEKLITEYNNRNEWDKNRIGNYFKRDRDKRFKQQLISEMSKEKLNRFNKILLHDFQEENYQNMDKRLLDNYHLIQFYLSNPYRSDEFDRWFSTKFFELDLDEQRSLLKEILDVRNRTIDLGGPVTAKKPSKNDSKLRMLLGNGDKLNYYMDVSSWFRKKTTPFALYEYLDRQSSISGGIWSGFKNTRANDLVKQWIKRDEERTGKSANELFQERMLCKTVDCIEGNSLTASEYELLEEKAIENRRVDRVLKSISTFQYYGEIYKNIKPKKSMKNYKNALGLLKPTMKKYPDNEKLIGTKSKIEKEIAELEVLLNKK